ncbi:MAG: response regulator transcription factor [Sandaracinaceae bacterium]|nr:response regulator transcription factor [Sandaracinaceae bacterium]
MSRWAKAALRTIERAYQVDRELDQWLRGLIAKPFLPFTVGASAGCFTLDTFEIVSLVATSPELERVGAQLSARLSPAERQALYARGISQFSARASQRTQALSGVTGIVEVWGTILHEPGLGGLALSYLYDRPRAIDAKQRRRVARVGAHMAAALRLRSREKIEEAILSPDGRLLDAHGRAAAHREALKRAATELDRARSRKTDPEDAIEAWRALVEGRWSLVERFESDGRRLLVARANPPELAPLHALTERERAIASRVGLGHPLKLIAYELGLSESTVSEACKSTRRKLGLRNRAELVELLVALGAATRDRAAPDASPDGPQRPQAKP